MSEREALLADWRDRTRGSFESKREPDCIHDPGRHDGYRYPASACNECQYGPELRRWITYWQGHPDFGDGWLRYLPGRVS